jgi:hypothetical protein
MSDFDSKHIRIQEVDVEEVPPLRDEALDSDLNRNLERIDVTTAQKQWQQVKKEKDPKKKYAAYMFLFCLFTGLGFTATFDVPVFLFMGLGTGFLAFIDPIYEKIMDKINSL